MCPLNRLVEDTAWHPVMPTEMDKWNPTTRALFKLFLGSPLKLWASIGHWWIWHFDLSKYTEKQKPRVSGLLEGEDGKRQGWCDGGACSLAHTAAPASAAAGQSRCHEPVGAACPQVSAQHPLLVDRLQSCPCTIPGALPPNTLIHPHVSPGD